MEDDIITASDGLVYCKAHQREVCYVCCCDHRFTNDIARARNADEEPDFDAIDAKIARAQEAEHGAMLAAKAAEGGRGPLYLGSEESERMYQAVAAAPSQRECTVCGMRGDRLKICSRCRTAHYCSREHQLEHFPAHKRECKRIAAARSAREGGGGAGAKERRISWQQLEQLGGQTAEGRTLELRVLSQPIPFLRHACDCKDQQGQVHRVAFYTDQPPAGWPWAACCGGATHTSTGSWMGARGRALRTRTWPISAWWMADARSAAAKRGRLGPSLAGARLLHERSHEYNYY